MKILIAVLLLALPALCFWRAVAAWRRGRRGIAPLWAVLGLALTLGNPLANAYLLAPLDSGLQRALFARAREAHLIGASEARVQEVLGKPWKSRTTEGRFQVLLYAPCKVCMASYGAPFAVYLMDGRVEGFRSGAGEVQRVARPDAQ
ncbi:MAG TPA: hypothetical protein VMK66_07550 [Myxococcales bacterium]|nr:hypothetical protein [Myxococcales bacterium]